MNSIDNKLIFACLGALMPDIIRILSVYRSGMIGHSRRKKVSKVCLFVSLVIAMFIAVVAFYLLNPIDKIGAFALGYAAPKILSDIGVSWQVAAGSELDLSNQELHRSQGQDGVRSTVDDNLLRELLAWLRT